MAGPPGTGGRGLRPRRGRQREYPLPRSAPGRAGLPRACRVAASPLFRGPAPGDGQPGHGAVRHSTCSTRARCPSRPRKAPGSPSGRDRTRPGPGLPGRDPIPHLHRRDRDPRRVRSLPRAHPSGTPAGAGPPASEGRPVPMPGWAQRGGRGTRGGPGPAALRGRHHSSRARTPARGGSPHACLAVSARKQESHPGGGIGREKCQRSAHPRRGPPHRHDATASRESHDTGRGEL